MILNKENTREVLCSINDYKAIKEGILRHLPYKAEKFIKVRYQHNGTISKCYIICEVVYTNNYGIHFVKKLTSK